MVFQLVISSITVIFNLSRLQGIHLNALLAVLLHGYCHTQSIFIHISGFDFMGKYLGIHQLLAVKKIQMSID